MVGPRASLNAGSAGAACSSCRADVNPAGAVALCWPLASWPSGYQSRASTTFRVPKEKGTLGEVRSSAVGKVDAWVVWRPMLLLNAMQMHANRNAPRRRASRDCTAGWSARVYSGSSPAPDRTQAVG